MDSKTVMEFLPKYLQKHKDEGFIETKNGLIIANLLACLHNRHAHTAFKWVKGHSGHPRNEGADCLAGAGAKKVVSDDLNMIPPPQLRISGAKLSTLSQKLAYRAIRARKECTSEQQPSTQCNLVRIASDLQDACNHQIRDSTIWTSLCKDITCKCRQFLWKTIHDAFMVRRWVTCRVCHNTESMDHIMFHCNTQGREQVENLLRKLWSHTDNLGLECLWTILATEAMYLVWKLQCKRVIQNDGHEFSAAEVQTRWYSTMNRQLVTWLPVLESNTDLPPKWMGDGRVSVNIKRGR
ncbi:hypothetical protein PYCCODRAFT_1443124 [Trametes coccinea BRFM310]|uniref:RNase H type-1 domain-containing protein n=1 Tax=Trametes coccinea (strain BRFM310) TaxID=1353009 RepID=A0A1Y2IYR6_TRAC3|nr:hypothetical protein PYCCODRAFT_1443124 [Trametes coccinea BRFM310]